MQLDHYSSKFKKQSFPITVVCDNVANAANIGSLFRISDAFGVDRLIFCGEPITIGRKVAKTSRATEKTVNYQYQKDILTAVRVLKENDYRIIALEITADSKPIHNYSFSFATPIALVVGDENFGVANDVLQMADDIIHVEMFGENSSMNVVQATNIALYEITRQLIK